MFLLRKHDGARLHLSHSWCEDAHGICNWLSADRADWNLPFRGAQDFRPQHAIRCERQIEAMCGLFDQYHLTLRVLAKNLVTIRNDDAMEYEFWERHKI